MLFANFYIKTTGGKNFRQVMHYSTGPSNNFLSAGYLTMNILTHNSIRVFSYTFLFALSVPITASATMQEQVTVGVQPVATATGTCANTTDVDLIVQQMDNAKKDLTTRHISKSENNLQQAFQEMKSLQKNGSVAVTERITIKHGQTIDEPGYFDTGNTYYSPDMQDMRLLKMAEADLKAGESHAACSVLSAVRFPYVSANAQIPLQISAQEANQALKYLKLNEVESAMTDINRFNVTTASYASITQ